jgi:ElaA protein
MYGDGSVTGKISIALSKVAGVIELHVARFGDLDTDTLYAILQLRCDVFIVEQECAYPDVDGRDTEPGTRHVWLTAADTAPTNAPAAAPRLVAYLRILDDRDGAARIGRVCVARDARRAGHAAALMAGALDLIGTGRDAVLDAQTYATRLYEDAGFVRDGDEFLDDGIMHVPMRRMAQ